MFVKSSEHKIILYKDIGVYRQEYRELSKLLFRFRQLETENKYFANYVHALTLQNYLDKITESMKEIEKLVSPKRIKRGWFDIIGTAFHTLFGVMDANDEDYYNSLIDQLNKQNKETLALMKTNAHISKSVMSNLNRTLNKFKSFESSVEQNLHKLELFVNSVSQKVNQQIVNQQLLLLSQQFLEYAILLSNELEVILETINFAQLGTLYTQIIPVEIFIAEINNIPNNQDKVLSKITKFNILDYYKIIRPRLLLSNSLLIIELIVPLVVDTEFALKRVYTYPIPNGDVFHVVKTQNPYVGISSNQNYVLLNSLEGCVELQDITLCPHIPIMVADHSSPCEVLMLTNKEFPNTCGIVTLTLKEVNMQYLGKNTWILFVSEEMEIISQCKGKPILRNKLNSSCLITMDPLCSIYSTNGIILEPETIEVANITLNNTLPLLNEDCCIEEIKRIQNLQLEPMKIGSFHFQDVNVLEEELNRFEKKTEELYDAPLRQIKQGWWYYTLGFCGTILMTLCCCYLCCPGCLRLCNPFRPCVVIKQTFNTCTRSSGNRIVPVRRPSYRDQTPKETGADYDIELTPIDEERLEDDRVRCKKFNIFRKY